MTKKMQANRKKREQTADTPNNSACEVMTAAGWEYFEGPDMSIDFHGTEGALVVVDQSGPKGSRKLRHAYAAGRWSEARSVPVRVPETAPASAPAG